MQRLSDRLGRRSTGGILLTAAVAGLGVCSSAPGQTVAYWSSPVNGTWTDGTKWSPRAPGTGYDAVIDTVGSKYFIRMMSGATLNNLTLNSPDASLDHYTGTLRAGVLRLAAGSFNLQWGTIADTTIRSLPGDTGTLVLWTTTAALDNVTLEGDIGLPYNGELEIYNGLRLSNHNVNVTAGNDIIFQDSAGLSGIGEIVINQRPNSSGFRSFIFAASGTFNIGSGITVRTGSSGGAVGIGDYEGDVDRRTVNLGTISAQSYGAPVSLSGLLFANSGTIESRDAGTVNVFALDNSGTVNVYASSTVNLAANWSNPAGVINVFGGTLVISDTFTESRLGSYTIAKSGLIGIAGTLTNNATTLSIGGDKGRWGLFGGRIVGGTIISPDNTPLVSISGGTLDSVTLQAPLSIPSNVVTLTNAWHNHNTISLDGGTLALRGTWDNKGVITGNGTVVTTGNWTYALLGALEPSGISLFLGGTLNNVGKTLSKPATGTWLMAGGTINGGSIATAPGSPIAIRNSGSGTLNGVTLTGEIQIGSGGALDIYSGLTLQSDARITVGSGSSATATLNFRGAQTLGGNGEVVLEGWATSGSSRAVLASETLTIGGGITVRSGLGSGTVGTAGRKTANGGNILSRTADRFIGIAGTFTNSGTVAALNHGSIILPAPANLTNYSAGVLTGGTWSIGASSTMTFGSSTITTNNANIILDGLGSTFAAINPLQNNLGQFTITNGRNFNTVGSLTNSGSIMVGPQSVLTVLQQLNNASGLIDMNNKLIVDYTGASPLDDLVGQIGTHIISSAAIADPNLAIGSMDNGDVVLLQLTDNGDANLDGSVDYTDLTTLSSNYSDSLLPLRWVDGDFNYDGSVNITDLYALGYNYADPAHPFEESLADLGLPIIEVPEPAALAPLLCGAACSLHRARRRRN